VIDNHNIDQYQSSISLFKTKNKKKELDKDLKFGFQRNGSLVVARGKEEHPLLEELLSRGKTNGVKGLKILDQDEV
jgi:glycerol-3-phosphate dehydrogenase